MLDLENLNCDGSVIAVEQEVKEFESLSELLEDLDKEGITGYQRKQLIDRFFILRSRLSGHPFGASFELTPLCNFDCKMCYVHLSREQANREGAILSTDEWLEIVKQAVEAGIMYADITGGECLSYPGFKQIYLYLLSHGVRVSILTNGSLLNSSWVEFFSRNRPAVIQITLYGSSSEAYLKVTQKDAFQDVLAAIDGLKKAKINVKLAMTPSKYMEEDGIALLDLFHSLNIPYTIGTGIMPARPETGREYTDFVADIQACARILEQDQRYRQHTVSVETNQTKPYSFRIKNMEQIKGMPCAGGSASFHVNWKGEITPCIPLYTIARTAKNGKLLESWKWIRERISEYILPEECQRCKYAKICKACPAERTSCDIHGEVNRYVCKKCEYLVSSLSLDDAQILNEEIQCSFD